MKVRVSIKVRISNCHSGSNFLIKLCASVRQDLLEIIRQLKFLAASCVVVDPIELGIKALIFARKPSQKLRKGPLTRENLSYIGL